MSEFCPGLSTQVPFHRPRPDDTQLGTSGPGAVITYCQPPPQVLHTDTTLHHYIHTYCISILHGLPGSPFGPTGFANCEVDPAGAQGLQADSLSVVYWWLAVIVKKKNQNAAVLQHFWAKSIQRFYLRLSVCYSTVYYTPLFIK